MKTYVTVSSPEQQRRRVKPPSRVGAARALARAVKTTAAAVAVVALGVFALIARATHAGTVKHASTPPALSAPKSFVTALSTSLAPGSIGPASAPAQAVSGGS
jgi:hypothetical protein